MFIFLGDHECGSSSQRTLSVQEAAAYLKVSGEFRTVMAIFLRFYTSYYYFCKITT